VYDIQEIENSVRNQLKQTDQSFHSWYQFVLGFPPHLVRYYINKFEVNNESRVLDPFCGTGTTNVECKKLNIESLGLEANPMAYFASRVKTNWQPASSELRRALEFVMASAVVSFEKFGFPEDISLFSGNRKGAILPIEPKLTEEELKVLPKDFISPQPLRRILVLRECVRAVEDEETRDLLLLAVASLTVGHASNVAFGPEIYTTKPKKDVRVLDHFFGLVDRMVCDLEAQSAATKHATIVHGDARKMSDFFPRECGRVQFVITSPPYPNEKDYTRTTRLESIILGLITSKDQLRALKENLMRSNSRNVFVDDSDHECVKPFDSVTRLADSIEEKRIRMGKTSGFEKLYHRIVRNYFGGMYRHLESLKPLLSAHARLAYVVGDQMSFFQTHIATAHILAEIAERLGYKVNEIELWRTRLSTATKRQIDENVLILSTD